MSDRKTVERTSVVALVTQAAAAKLQASPSPNLPQQGRKNFRERGLKNLSPNWWHCHPANANANHSSCKAQHDSWPKPRTCPCDCHK